jgi:hypothetical protein
VSETLLDGPGAALPLRAEGVVSRSLGARLVLYHPVSREVSVLNATAAAVWEMCDGATPVADAVERLRQRFHVGDTRDVAGDVAAVVRTLVERGLVISSLTHSAAETAG